MVCQFTNQRAQKIEANGSVYTAGLKSVSANSRKQLDVCKIVATPELLS